VLKRGSDFIFVTALLCAIFLSKTPTVPLAGLDLKNEIKDDTEPDLRELISVANTDVA
jgi:hypothetical protein